MHTKMEIKTLELNTQKHNSNKMFSANSSNETMTSLINKQTDKVMPTDS